MSFPLSKTQCLCTIDGVSIDRFERTTQKPVMLRTTGTSGFSMGGTLILGEDLVEFGFDAELERQNALQLLDDPQVERLESQAVSTPYFDEDGKLHKTIWDFRVTYKDGHVGLKSVKSLSYAMTDQFAARWELICAGIPAGVADSVQLLTEDTIDPVKVDRASLFNKALTTGQPQAARDAYEFLAAQTRPVPIQDVCNHLRLRSPVPDDQYFRRLSVEFWAVIWLMAKRAAKLCSDGYITMKSLVGLS